MNKLFLLLVSIFIWDSTLIYGAGSNKNFLFINEIPNSLLMIGENQRAQKILTSERKSTKFSSTKFCSAGISMSGTRNMFTGAGINTTISFESSNLPIFIINTNGKEIVDEPKTEAWLKVIYNGEGKRNNLSDTVFHYNGQIGIELRGNSTMTFPKKPYTFETRNTGGENVNVPLLGFPAENDWILRASYYDQTFIRNPLGHHLSRLMGHWASGNKYCELILNGQYKGIYILVEKIKRTPNRLNLEKLNADEISGTDLTGGYIYEVAGQHNDFGFNRRLRYPELDEVAMEQLQFIKNYDNRFRIESSKDYSDDPKSFYNEWIDLQSFVDFVLVQEVTRNPDGIGWSGYFYKDKGKPLCAGPVWDFDQSLCNSTFSEGIRYDLWIIDYEEPPNPPFWKKMLHEPYFESELKKRWDELRQNQFKDEKLLAYIDSIALYLSEAVERNFVQWPTLNKKIWREVAGFDDRDTYQKHIDHLKNYLVNRMEWMDNKLAKVQPFPGTDNTNNLSSVLVFPNPANDYIKINFSLISNDYVTFNIYNPVGRIMIQQKTGFLLAGRNSEIIQLNKKISPGIYFVQIKVRESVYATTRFLVSE